MSNITYLIRKYWSKHKKSAAALLFSGVLLAIVITVSFLQLRANFNRDLHNYYYLYGYYDAILPDASDELLSEISDDNTVNGEIYALGKATVRGEGFTYGYIDDPQGLAHIPFESGRFPKSSSEIAIDRGVLNRIGYVGKLGDSISLDIGRYTLVGIIDETYGEQRLNSEINISVDPNFPETIPPDPIPLIFVCPDNIEKYDYLLTMLNNLSVDQETFQDLVIEEYGDDAQWISYADKSNTAAFTAEWSSTGSDTRLIYIMSGLAAFISILSVLAVLRNIFAEREGSMQMLHKIGLSKSKIRLMYAAECVIFIVLQTIIGIALGIICYLFIYVFQINVLNMTPHWGLTLDPYVTSYTTDPYLAACAFSFVVLPIGYIFVGMLSTAKAYSSHSKKAASLRICFSRIFRTAVVTVIQTAALTLICVGTLIGYMFFTDNGKEYIYPLSYLPPTIEEFSDGFSFEEKGLSEYYSSAMPVVSELGSFKFTNVSDIPFGINDETADKLQDSVSTGKLENTFIIVNSSNSGLKRRISLGTKEEKEFIITNSADEFKSVFSEELSPMQTALADKKTISLLSQYVVSGEIDLDKLDSGEQVLLIVKYGEAPLSVNESITLASATTENGLGISDLLVAKTAVGAVIEIPSGVDKLLKYAVSSKDDQCLLTTASGASALGFPNAVYTEIFAEKPLNGELIPMDSGMTLLSYSQQKREIIIQKATQYGGTALIVLIMSLLGFAAYFNGIGMKIRLKEYEISTLRAIGISVKTLRRKLTIYSLKLPVISCAIAFAGIKFVQRIAFSAYEQMLEMWRITYEQIPEKYANASFEEKAAYQAEMRNKIDALSDKYFINNELWLVKPLIPMLIILAVMSIVTILLTRSAFKRFDSDISESMSRGRKRQ